MASSAYKCKTLNLFDTAGISYKLKLFIPKHLCVWVCVLVWVSVGMVNSSNEVPWVTEVF